MKNNNENNMIKNLFFAFIAQIISLLLSVVMSLFVPQILNIHEFSYWQLFIFYSGYSGFFHLGLNDGIYLREGGRSYKDLNVKLINGQFRVSLLFHFLLTLIITFYAFIFIEDQSRRIVWIATGIYLPLFNANGFMGYIFQAVNRTKIYSISVIVDKIFFIIVALCLVFLRVEYFEIFISMYILSKLIALCYCCWQGREIIFSKTETLKIVFKEILVNTSVGINLMFSNIAGSLVLGIGRIIIDRVWGIVAFGKISFSVILTYFFLTFIGQISMVLFPALRQVNRESLKKFYTLSSDVLNIILPSIFVLYIPLKYLLLTFLPEYKDSLDYLILFLPVCLFDGKMNMLCSTYFKVLRKEKFLLRVNVLSLLVSVTFCLLGAYAFNNLNVVIVSMVISIAIRSFISELYLSKLMGTKIMKNIVSEWILILIFICSNWFFSPLLAFVTYLVMYIFYCVIHSKKIFSILTTTKLLVGYKK
ncbi:oligosaccharide flippase family protein [Paenibacillus sp. FSL R5-0912]|uniref:lipopolysaccharide biosynthesis protein n=1 Tax=Paenibacillus sp. FSL R5-0912 TaxID=1536771 RepID=UPI0004F87655|nr:oligosaccharide flippase family protein [Paenibacillus sp. FSL R5-0912]AIQ43311.1 hypothetical protein R50912_27295 [Paenibacillus sp. FSL R5-0912]